MLNKGKRQTVKATMPVSVTCNGNVKKPKDLTDSRNGPRYRNRLLLFVICFLLLALFFIQLSSEAKITGVCSNCHTMHNSQNGQPVARGDAPWGGTGGSTATRPQLLVASCLGCHSSTVNNETVRDFGGSKIPIVFNTGGYPSNALAGGNFYYVSLGGEENDAKGHNIFSQDAKLTMGPGNNAGCGTSGTNCCHYNLYGTSSGMTGFEGLNDRQGCTKCHMVNSYGPPRGYHHINDGTGTKYVDTLAKGWYRFLRAHYSAEDKGVVGIEDENWQYTNSATDHNEYLGCVTTHDSAGSMSNCATTTQFCTGCHQWFHVVDSTAAGDSPWLRHPVEAVIPNSGEYTGAFGASGGVGTYNPDIPVARPSGFNWAGGPNGTVTLNSDMVMCLSCHRAHASPYFKMMRWNYKGWPGAGTGGCDPAAGKHECCSVCHTSKN